MTGMNPVPRAFCQYCGEPYPWTEKGLTAADELVEEMGNLSPQEREVLKSSIHDIIQQNPHQAVAEIRIKKMARQIGSEGAGFLRNALQNYVSSEVLKSLLGS